MVDTESDEHNGPTQVTFVRLEHDVRAKLVVKARDAGYRTLGRFLRDVLTKFAHDKKRSL